jgi:hypothetical protein
MVKRNKNERKERSMNYQQCGVPQGTMFVPCKKFVMGYRKPPTISPGLIYFRKRFLMGLYKGGLIYGGG